MRWTPLLGAAPGDYRRAAITLLGGRCRVVKPAALRRKVYELAAGAERKSATAARRSRRSGQSEEDA